MTLSEPRQGCLLLVNEYKSAIATARRLPMRVWMVRSHIGPIFDSIHDPGRKVDCKFVTSKAEARRAMIAITERIAL